MKTIKRHLVAALTIVFAVCLSLAVFAACAPTEDEMYEVTVNADANGSVTLTPEAEDGKYESGTEVTVKVTPSNGYEVNTFTVSGFDAAKLDANNEYKFKVTADTTIDVTFKTQGGGQTPSVDTYTVTVNPVTHGRVELSPAKTDNKYKEGDDITVTVIPASGYEVESFKVNGTETPLNGDTYVINDISENITIDVTFTLEEVEQHTITVNCGDNGSYTLAIGSQSLTGTENVYTVDEGSNVTLTVTPEGGYEVDAFTVSGDANAALSDQNTYVIQNVTGNVEITITFKPVAVTHKITVTCGTNGSYTLAIGADALVGAENVYTVNEGSDVIITVTPETGYEVDTFTVSGDEEAELSGDGKYTISDISADVTINITFKVAPLEFDDAYMNNGAAWGQVRGGQVSDAAILTVKFTSKTTVTVNNKAATIESGNAQEGYVVKFDDNSGERTIIVKYGALVLIDKTNEWTPRTVYLTQLLETYEIPENLQNTTWTCTAANDDFTSTRQLEFKDNKATFGSSNVYNLAKDTDGSVWGLMNNEWLNIVVDADGKNATGKLVDGTTYMTLVKQGGEEPGPSDTVFADSYYTPKWKYIDIANGGGIAPNTKKIEFSDDKKTVTINGNSATLVSGSEAEGYTVKINNNDHRLFVNDGFLIWIDNNGSETLYSSGEGISDTLTIPAGIQNSTMKGQVNGAEQTWVFKENYASLGVASSTSMFQSPKSETTYLALVSAKWYRYVVSGNDIKVYLMADNSEVGTLTKDSGAETTFDASYEGTWKEVNYQGAFGANQVVISSTTFTVMGNDALLKGGNAKDGYDIEYTEYSNTYQATLRLIDGVLVFERGGASIVTKVFAKTVPGKTITIPAALQNKTLHSTSATSFSWQDKTIVFTENTGKYNTTNDVIYFLSVDGEKEFYIYTFMQVLHFIKQGDGTYKAMQSTTEHSTWEVQGGAEEPSVVFADSYWKNTWLNINAVGGKGSADRQKIVFTDNKTVTVNGSAATLVSGNETDGYTLKIGGNDHKLFLNDGVLIWVNNVGSVQVYYTKDFSETLKLSADFQNATFKGMVNGSEQVWNFTTDEATTDDDDVMLSYDKDNIWWCGYGTSAVWYKYVIESSEIKVYLASDNSLKGILSKDGGGSAQPSGLKVDKTYEGTWSEVQAGGSLKAGNQIVLGADGVYTIGDKTLTVKSGDAQTGYTINYTEYSSVVEATILLKEGVLVYTQPGGYSTTLKVYSKTALTGTLNIPESLKNKTLHSTYASSKLMWEDKTIVFTKDKGTFHGMSDNPVDIIINIDGDKEFYLFTFGYLFLFQKQDDGTYKAMQGTTHHSTWEVQSGAEEPALEFDDAYINGNKAWGRLMAGEKSSAPAYSVTFTSKTEVTVTNKKGTIKSGNAQDGYVVELANNGGERTLILKYGVLVLIDKTNEYTPRMTLVSEVLETYTVPESWQNITWDCKAVDSGDFSGTKQLVFSTNSATFGGNTVYNLAEGENGSVWGLMNNEWLNIVIDAGGKNANGTCVDGTKYMTLVKQESGSVDPEPTDAVFADSYWKTTWIYIDPQDVGWANSQKKITFTDNKTVTVNGTAATLVSGSEAEGYTIKVGQNTQKLFLNDGVLVLKDHNDNVSIYYTKDMDTTLTLPAEFQNATLKGTVNGSEQVWTFTANSASTKTFDKLLGYDKANIFWCAYGFDPNIWLKYVIDGNEIKVYFPADNSVAGTLTKEVVAATKFDSTYEGTWTEVNYQGAFASNKVVINADGKFTIMDKDGTLKDGDAKNGYNIEYTEYSTTYQATLRLVEGVLVFERGGASVQTKVFAKTVPDKTITIPAALQNKTLHSTSATNPSWNDKTIVFTENTGKYNTTNDVIYFLSVDGENEFYIYTFMQVLHFIKQGDGTYKAMQSTTEHSTWEVQGGAAKGEFTVTNNFDTAHGKVVVEYSENGRTYLPDKGAYDKFEMLRITLTPDEGYTIGEFFIANGGEPENQLDPTISSITSNDDGTVYYRDGLTVKGNIVITGKFVATSGGAGTTDAKFAADIKGKTWLLVNKDKNPATDAAKKITFTDDTNVSIDGTTLTLTSVEKENVYVLSVGKLYYVPGVDALVYVNGDTRTTYVTALTTSFDSFPAGFSYLSLMKDTTTKLYFSGNQILLGNMSSAGMAANFSGTADDFWLIANGEVLHIVKNPEKKHYEEYGGYDVWEYNVTYADGTACDTYTVDA